MFDQLITSNWIRKIGLRVQGCRKIRTRVVLNMLPLNKHDTLLDVGCGWGSSVFELIDRVSMAVVTDIQINLVKDCKKVLSSKKEKISPVTANGTHLPFKNKIFSKIICMDVIEHIVNDKLLLMELYRVLDEGYLVITTPNTEMPQSGNEWVRFLPQVFRRKPNQHDYPYDQEYGHKRDGYSSKNIESLLMEAGFEVVKHEYAYKGIINSLNNFLWETRLYRIGTVFLFPILWLDRFYKGIGASHVILAKKIYN